MHYPTKHKTGQLNKHGVVFSVSVGPCVGSVVAPRRVGHNGDKLVRPLCCGAGQLNTTFVFMQAAVFVATTSPRGANEITKTKLQTNTQTRSLHKHAVAGSGASTPNLFCNQPVHRHGLSFTVRFTFIISFHDSSTCLFSVARRPVSPVTLIRDCHMCEKSPPCRMLLLRLVY